MGNSGWSNDFPNNIVIGQIGQAGSITVLRADGTLLATLNSAGLTFYDATGTHPLTEIDDSSDIVLQSPNGSGIVLSGNQTIAGNEVSTISFPSKAAVEQLPAEFYASYNATLDFIELFMNGPESNEASAGGYYRIGFTSGGDFGFVSPQFLLQFINASGGFTDVLESTNGGQLIVTAPISFESLGWVAVNLGTGWSDFGGAYAPVETMLMPDGTVHMRGAAAWSGGATGSSVVGQVQSGYQPGFRAGGLVPDVNTANGVCSIHVDTNLNITAFGVAAGAVLAFDMVSYPGPSL